MSVSPPGHVRPLESSPPGKASARPMASRLCLLQCRAAETPPETDVDASNPRPGAAAGSLSREQSARSCRTRLKEVRKRLIVRHPSNSRGYTPLQKAHGTGGEMVGDGFKALSGPTRCQGGCSYSFVNWAMLFSRLNRDMLTPGLSADGLQSVRSASTRRRRAPCPA